MNYLIESADLVKHTRNHASLLSYIKEKIEEYIFNINKESYTSYFGSPIIRFMADDFKSGELKLLTPILNQDYIRQRNVVFNEIMPSFMDGIYHYEKFDIFIVKFFLSGEHGNAYKRFIYAKNDESFQNFQNYLKEKEKNRSKEYVHVFYDTKHGLRQEEEKMSRILSREDIFLDETIKEDVFRNIDRFFSEDGKKFYSEFNIPHKRGILLYGRPGNGKTTLVKSIAGSVNAPVIYYQINEHTTGETIKEVFREAVDMSPVILIMEDIDSIPQNSRSSLLNALDGATTSEGIFVIGTTNYPERIDEGLMNRAGRFDRVYQIDLPNEEIRYDFLKKSKLPSIASDTVIKEIAILTDEFSLAQLSEFYTTAALDIFDTGKFDYEKIISSMRSNLNKQKRNEWEENEASMGFK
jgi:SpoVK/Ycf46/Vps4 family AAA+-type ATPase